MKKIVIILLILNFLSCKNKSQNKVSTAPKLVNTQKVENLETKQVSNSTKRVKIDFNENKDLLDIILLLPDAAFPSWEWKLDERIKWYNEIKENNYYTDNDPFYFNQVYFKPYKAGFSIVDGFWSINIYKTSENSYIVITDDVVGDGNTLNFYEVKNSIIKEYLNEEIMFSNFKEQLKKKENVENCAEKFEEMNDPIFQFDFTNKNKVEIESSWYLNKEDYETCLNGNAITYNFNPKTKKFELKKIYWKTKEKE